LVVFDFSGNTIHTLEFGQFHFSLGEGLIVKGFLNGHLFFSASGNSSAFLHCQHQDQHVPLLSLHWHLCGDCSSVHCIGDTTVFL
ncbi:mCG144551, partial [Mus musculus]